jgi:hypothetical protein
VVRHKVSLSVSNSVSQWFLLIRYLAKRAEGGVTGKEIQAKALEVAQSLQMFDFKASNGWLAAFYKRHNLAKRSKPSHVDIMNLNMEFNNFMEMDTYPNAAGCDSLCIR